MGERSALVGSRILGNPRALDLVHDSAAVSPAAAAHVGPTVTSVRSGYTPSENQSAATIEHARNVEEDCATTSTGVTHSSMSACVSAVLACLTSNPALNDDGQPITSTIQVPLTFTASAQ